MGKLNQFNEDTIGGFWMDEGDSGVVGAGSRSLIGHLGAFCEIVLNLLLDIIHLEADVVNTRTFRLQKFCEG